MKTTDICRQRPVCLVAAKIRTDVGRHHQRNWGEIATDGRRTRPAHSLPPRLPSRPPATDGRCHVRLLRPSRWGAAPHGRPTAPHWAAVYPEEFGRVVCPSAASARNPFRRPTPSSWTRLRSKQAPRDQPLSRLLQTRCHIRCSQGMDSFSQGSTKAKINSVRQQKQTSPVSSLTLSFRNFKSSEIRTFSASRQSRHPAQQLRDRAAYNHSTAGHGWDSSADRVTFYAIFADRVGSGYIYNCGSGSGPKSGPCPTVALSHHQTPFKN